MTNQLKRLKDKLHGAAKKLRRQADRLDLWAVEYLTPETERMSSKQPSAANEAKTREPVFSSAGRDLFERAVQHYAERLKDQCDLQASNYIMPEHVNTAVQRSSIYPPSAVVDRQILLDDPLEARSAVLVEFLRALDAELAREVRTRGRYLTGQEIYDLKATAAREFLRHVKPTNTARRTAGEVIRETQQELERMARQLKQVETS